MNKNINKDNNVKPNKTRLITFVYFFDIINFKTNLLYNYRKCIVYSQNDSKLLIYDELPRKKIIKA